MCLLALIVGAIGGIGAWAFRLLIGLLHNLLFLQEAQLAYDANQHTSVNPWGMGIILVPVAGAVVVTWLVKTFAPEAKGHGVPEVIDAIHYHGGTIRPVVAIVKSIASAVCIGSGGSVGREGPIIQIGSAFGSTVGQLLHIPARQRITLVAAGAAAGIAATFNAPLGGIVFAIELLLVSINVRTLLPVSIATVTATYFGEALLGTHPAFDLEVLRTTDFQLQSPWLMMSFIPFGLLMGLASILFVKGIYWAEDAFDAMPGNEYTRHCSGMLLVGIILFAMFHVNGKYFVEGIGYSTIMDVLASRLTDPGFLLFLCVLKLITTFLTIGSGGSGGVFSPAMFVGATLGASFGLTVHMIVPGFPIDVVMFALAGMAAMIGASTGAIVTASVMLNEMTDDVNIIMPVIITSVIACAVRKLISPSSIYTLKLIRRGHIVPEGLQAALDDARNVAHLMSTNYQIVADDESDPIPSSTKVTILGRDGEIKRLVDPLVPVVQQSADTPVSWVMVRPGDSLVSTLRKMHLAGVSIAVVTSTPESSSVDNVVGVLTPRELHLYRTELAELFE
ncbi:H(+)/Cl(-) exchange transporter ClcA [Planctomycetes bacterium FF15]|uniref:H(+)/Cl(-) exchange transporter ClcA n=2 Tax=Bremerella alba TaxID=980252 RepID=A0A7V8V178_9BACT|nr:H(+)/Cl(-) exchange transporter ClcA [Bremerella alba]